MVTFIVIGLIVCVAALNILIALTMMVMEKTKDIAVLMSFGVQPGQVRRIFLMQGFLISVVGTVLGLVLGYLLAWAGRPLSLHSSFGGCLFDRLPAVCAAADRWRDCDGGFAGGVAAGDALSIEFGGQGASRRGAAVRVSEATRRDLAYSDLATNFGSASRNGTSR